MWRLQTQYSLHYVFYPCYLGFHSSAFGLELHPRLDSPPNGGESPPTKKLSFYRQASSRITALDKKFFMPELKFGIQDDRGVQNHHFIVECILVKMVF